MSRLHTVCTRTSNFTVLRTTTVHFVEYFLVLKKKKNRKKRLPRHEGYQFLLLAHWLQSNPSMMLDAGPIETKRLGLRLHQPTSAAAPSLATIMSHLSPVVTVQAAGVSSLIPI